MKNRIVTTIPLILLLCLAGLLVYLNNVFFPVKVKAIVTKRLSHYLGKNVEIERLKYDLFKGIVIENASIFQESKEEGKKYYIKINTAYGNFLILPILRERKIIIPALHIEAPQLYLTRNRDKSFNLEEFFKKAPAPKTKPRYTFIIYKIIISSGTCDFNDQSLSPAFKLRITDLKIGAEFNLPSKINFLIEGKRANKNSDISSALNFSGNYNLQKQEMDSNLTLNKVPLNEYPAYLKNLPLPLSIGFIDTLNLNIKLKTNQELKVKGGIITKNLQLRLNKYILAGNFNFYPDFKYSFSNRKLAYSGTIKLFDVTLSGIEKLKEITRIQGDLKLEEDNLSSDNLNMTLFDIPLSVKGTMNNFSNPLVKLNISGEEIDLSKLSLLFPNLTSNLSLTGSSTLNMDIRGYLRKFPSEINGTSQIISASLSSPYLKNPLTELKGKIGFSLNEFNWDNINLIYQKETFKSSGKLINFKFPQINFVLVSEKLNMEALFYIRDKLIKINNCNGKYLSSDFNLKGNVDAAIADNLNLDLSLKSDFALKDTYDFLEPAWKERFQNLKLSGTCKMSGSLNGKIKDLKDLNLALNASFPLLSIYDLKFENLRIRINQKNRYLFGETLPSKFYNGNLSLNLDSNLNTENPIYNTKIALSDVDLSLLKADTDLKDKNLAGLLTLEANLQTDKGIENLSGKGHASIKNGRLWDLNLLKGLGKLLLLPIYEQIVFKKAQGNFIVKDQAFHTNDFFLGSRSVDMLCRGKVDFKGNLDLTMNTEIVPDLLIDSADLRKFTSPIFGNLLTINVSGTIQDPKYKTSIITKEIFKEIKRFFLGR